MNIKPLIEVLRKLGNSSVMDSIRKIGKLGILGALIMLVIWLPEITPGYISDYFNKGEGGIVLVDSPEVYSRERLINDRFRQVSWLEEELRKSPDLPFGNQAISDLHQILRMDTQIGGTSGGDKTSTAQNGTTGKTDKSRPGASVSPSERFRDIRAYREEIRTEMMETLLDDRHDIKGNTLYRLKFDTTVLPEENTEKLVVIQTKLRRADFCKPGTTRYPNHLSDPTHAPCISIKAIHDSWLKQTEEKINSAIEGTIRSFKRRNLSTADFAELVRFLQKKVPGQKPYTASATSKAGTDGRDTKLVASENHSESDTAELVSKNIDSWDNLNQFLPTCVEQAKTSEEGWWEKVKATCPEVSAAGFFLINPDPKFSAQNNEVKARYNKLRKLLLRFYTKKLNLTKSYSEFKKLHEGFPNVDYNMDKREIYNQTLKQIGEAEIAEQNLLRFAAVGMWIDKYTYPNNEKLEKCKTLYDDKLEVFDPKSLSCIAHLEKTICDDVDYCTVRVEAKVPEPRLRVICDETTEDGDYYNWCQVRRVFERLLKIDESYYSYAVTPKESAQRVLTIASERRQKQLALSLIASSADGLDPTTINSITRAISDSATHIEQIQRKPLILSFGRGQPVAVNAKSNAKRGIDFGWIIGPKFLFSDRSNGKIKFYHAPTQNSLSAVISVPSWWTAINLEIDTCWIDQDEIPELQKESVKGLNPLVDRNYLNDLCNTGLVTKSHNVDVDYLIRLPGSAEELPRKFGYEIERVPAISRGGVLADFYVGQKFANLIIQGNELWRSTVVTMGHQKADSIEVLPNMKGIIATFNTVDIPSWKMMPDRRQGGSGKCFVESEVVVWTSEGRTPAKQLLANIHANPLLGPNAQASKPGVYPEGFGGCTNLARPQQPPVDSQQPDGPQAGGPQGGDGSPSGPPDNKPGTDTSQLEPPQANHNTGAPATVPSSNN